MPTRTRIIGIDPGLRFTGWGVIERDGSRLIHIAHGRLKTSDKADLALRLVELFEGLKDILSAHEPKEAAVEKTFVNKDGAATLKLGHARAVAMLIPALKGLPVAEYAPNLVKKSLVGSGHADKDQVQMMVNTLLPTANVTTPDAADALAIAICHAHHASSRIPAHTV